MEGKATLTLTEAKTGRVVKQLAEHNLVTDAVKRILDPPLYTMLYRFDFKNFINCVLPLYKLFSGIVLLGNTLEERKDNIMFDGSCIPIATAGSPYSGANVRRGTLNENESGETADGYRFTWDFATDKANGVIKSVALTNKYFGDSGFEFNDSKGRLFMDPSSINGEYYYDTEYMHATGQYIGTFEDRLHLYVINVDGKLRFFKYSSPNAQSLGLNDPISLSEYAPYDFIAEVKPPIAINFFFRCFVDHENRLVYFFSKVYASDDREKYYVDYFAVDINTFKATEVSTQCLGTESSSFGFALFDGKLYHMLSKKLLVYSIGGDVIREYENVSYSSTSRFAIWNNTLTMLMGTRKIGLLINDEIIQFFAPGDLLPAYGCDIQPPYYPMVNFPWLGIEESVSRNPALGLASNYFATINNLSEPLEKTSEHNLKITYDIMN